MEASVLLPWLLLALCDQWYRITLDTGVQVTSGAFLMSGFEHRKTVFVHDKRC